MPERRRCKFCGREGSRLEEIRSLGCVTDWAADTGYRDDDDTHREDQ